MMRVTRVKMPRGLAKLNVAPRQIGERGALAVAEQNVVVHDADTTRDHFN